MKLKITFRPKLFLAFILFNIVFTILAAPFILFWGPFTGLKVVAVGAVVTSRHPQFVQAFLSQAEIEEITHSNDSLGVGSSQAIERKVSELGTENEKNKDNGIDSPQSGIMVEEIQGSGFKGKVMLIKDPQRVKIAVTEKLGVTGQKLGELVKGVGAVAGINAGGFYDPDGKGNGGFPDGLTIHNGQVVYNNIKNQAVSIVGIDDSLKLIMGTYSANQLLGMHVQEAVSFGPELVVNGKPVIAGDGGWGMAPRTGIGQTADGTIIFVVIDGREPTWSWGATLRDLMNVFLQYHAINAYNLDGGSSAELVYNGDILNRPCSPFGERYLPTAFVVMPEK